MVKQGKYRVPATYAVESDASSSTYPLSIAAITVCGCSPKTSAPNFRSPRPCA